MGRQKLFFGQRLLRRGLRRSSQRQRGFGDEERQVGGKLIRAGVNPAPTLVRSNGASTFPDCTPRLLRRYAPRNDKGLLGFGLGSPLPNLRYSSDTSGTARGSWARRRASETRRRICQYAEEESDARNAAMRGLAKPDALSRGSRPKTSP